MNCLRVTPCEAGDAAVQFRGCAPFRFDHVAFDVTDDVGWGWGKGFSHDSAAGLIGWHLAPDRRLVTRVLFHQINT